MQVILLKDVPKVGRQFDVKSVADGFALNFLFPKKLAEAATKDKVASLEAKRAEIAHLLETSQDELVAAIKKLNGAKVTIKAGKANEGGSLYKGVNEENVAEALSKAAGAKISTDAFDLAQPIKSIGEHPLIIRTGSVESAVTLVVEAA